VSRPSENSRVFLCGLVANPARAGFIVLSEGRLAQARASRLSKIPSVVPLSR